MFVRGYGFGFVLYFDSFLHKVRFDYFADNVIYRECWECNMLDISAAVTRTCVV